jgi:hypothetical protein
VATFSAVKTLRNHLTVECPAMKHQEAGIIIWGLFLLASSHLDELFFFFFAKAHSIVYLPLCPLSLPRIPFN